MANGVKDLRVWQEAVQLGGEVVRSLKPSVRREIKLFTDQTIECGAGIAGALAAGYARPEAEEHRRAAAEARRQLAILETRLAIARHAGIISASTAAALAGRISLVGRLLHGYLGFLDRQVRQESAVTPEIADAVSAVVELGAE